MAENELFLVKDEETTPASPAANFRRRNARAIDWLTVLWRHPRKTWLRRALFQVHLWSGIAVGLVATVVGISGSAIV